MEQFSVHYPKERFGWGVVRSTSIPLYSPLFVKSPTLPIFSLLKSKYVSVYQVIEYIYYLNQVMDQNHGQIMMELMHWKVGGWQAIIYTNPQTGAKQIRNRRETHARRAPGRWRLTYTGALLIAHPLITAHTLPNYYAYTLPKKLRYFHFKLEHHVCLTCSHLNRENNTTCPCLNQYLAFALPSYPRARNCRASLQSPS